MKHFVVNRNCDFRGDPPLIATIEAGLSSILRCRDVRCCFTLTFQIVVNGSPGKVRWNGFPKMLVESVVRKLQAFFGAI